jgi:hypothetical protein
VPVSMMVPLNVSQSTIAAQSLGSVKVFAHPEKDSFEAIAIDLFSSRSVKTWTRRLFGPVPRDRVRRSSAGPKGLLTI